MDRRDKAMAATTELRDFPPHPSWCVNAGEDLSACAETTTLQGVRLHSVDHVSVDLYQLGRTPWPTVFLARTDEYPKDVGEVVVCIHGWYEDRDFEGWEARQLGYDLLAAADLADSSAGGRG